MTPRKRLMTSGERGSMLRLFKEERGRVERYVVQWGPKGAREQESFPATKVGKAEAEAFFNAFGEEAKKQEKERESPDAKRAPLTNRELWTAYLAAEAQHLRPNTLRLYRDAWRTWESFIKPDAIAQDTAIQQIHEFRQALDARNYATATVKDCIRNVRIVFNWGERNELLERNKWHLFVHKVAKEKRTKPRAEYRSDEFLSIWRALNPDQIGQWRAWVAVGLLGIYGNRQNEILNFQWDWITGDVVVIPSEYVKTGEEGTLTLFPLTRGVLDVARRWRERSGYTGAYVLYPGQYSGRKHQSKQPHYSIQSLTDAIHHAEKRAKPKVQQVKWRAGHGFRRGLVGDLVDQTGDVTLALAAVRDRDLTMASFYRVRRNDKVDDAVQKRANTLLPESATKVQPTARNDEAAQQDGSVTPTVTGA